MKPPPTEEDIAAVADWSSEGVFADADGKPVVIGDVVQLTRELPVYGQQGVASAPSGWFAEVEVLSRRTSFVLLNTALGDEQYVNLVEKMSLLRRARPSDRLKAAKNNA